MSKVHTHSGYEDELRQVRDNLLRMAGCVEEIIRNSVRSLVDGDLDLARVTIESDHKVNRFEIDTDELCLVILAKRQPMASDLRFITLAMKMVTDLERIGDLGVNIAERTQALAAMPSKVLIPAAIPLMADAARAMVRQAIDAFVEGDVARAEAVFAADDEVDEFYHNLCRALEREIEDKTALERSIHLRSVAKFLERIGDHATNLAEIVVFLVRGQDIRHLGKR